MVGLYKDPAGEKIFSTTPMHNIGGVKSQADTDKISALEGRIRELESELAVKKVCVACHSVS